MKKVLVANRGEIAVRIMRTARSLGIKTVAVYSEADAGMPHAEFAHEAYPIGPAPASESYLNQERILAAAKQCEADCIHPGYGFLAENPEFAEAVAKQGLTFIGPSAAAMRSLGHKDSARALAEKAGVPVVPGFHSDDSTDETLINAAMKIGLPVLLKARAGGGGKGMRTVREAKALKEAIAGARREGKAFFSDDRLLVEKLISPARHIEVQVIADLHGNVKTIFERECSIQRRHQKIIEETPAQGLSSGLRARIYEAAASLAKQAKLSSATTMEFILPVASKNPDDPFYFLEANCRIQVEHPVTEATTGLDLVELQFFVAGGGDLSQIEFPATQSGHAIEARIYAELPGREFLPTVGKIETLSFPQDPEIRVDHALAQGISVTTNYDPMLAKLIVHSSDRPHALAKMLEALNKTKLVGVETNIRFLEQLFKDPKASSGLAHTTYVDENIAALTDCYDDSPTLEAAACAFLVVRVKRFMQINNDIFVQSAKAGARLNEPLEQLGIYSAATSSSYVVSARVVEAPRGGTVVGCWEFEVDEDRIQAQVSSSPDSVELMLAINKAGPQAIHFRVVNDNVRSHTKVELLAFQQHLVVEQIVAKNADSGEDADSAHAIISPLPGKLISLNVEAGDTVAEGETVCVIESMKMEHTLCAGAASTVAEILAEPGAAVEQGQVLVRLSA
ncbi:MAG: ATP-grasp domain-containing protein [Bdellovibrionales bacterium]|nr:ATP-grasp domain-containing protein [Bdellovibrionales bacterium]